ncbi:MAG: hypothetical protein ABFS43_07405 [Thermodesulfobacteriota bacterium]
MNFSKRTYFVLMTIILTLTVANEAGAQCNQAATTSRRTRVYDRAPAFYTGSGWRLGNIITTIEANQSISICEEIEIGLFGDKKKWYRIEHGDIQGWVYSGDLNVNTSVINNKTTRQASLKFSLVSKAYAQGGDNNDSPLPSSGPNLALLYAFMFIITVIGMFGKVIYDEIDRLNEFSFKKCFKAHKCIKALIVAPIIFLMLLNTADIETKISISGATYILLFAFQNGFFWQTVLPTIVKQHS